MSSSHDDRRYHVARMDAIPPVACPCGQSRRAFLDAPDRIASLHVVTIDREARRHYHRRTTEIYYVLEGEGRVELDDASVEVRIGSSILIRPGCRHRAVGTMKIVNVAIPAFDLEDEWFD